MYNDIVMVLGLNEITNRNVEFQNERARNLKEGGEVIDGVQHTFKKGDRYFIPKGVQHYGKIYAGYADMTFFDQVDRYQTKNK